MTTITPIQKHITVAASPERAFDIFTADIGSWWNPEYSIGTEPLATVVIEGHEGGRWYERGEGGAECDWGRVLVWDPPQRLLLVWQITADWRHDPDLHTEVEVRFVPEGASTRVELEHRGLESLGAQAQSVRAIFDSPGGWPGLLARLAGAVAQ